MGLLELPFIRRTRCSHAVEHATVHILTERAPGRTLAGRADHNGFYIFGALEADELRAAVDEAIERLKTEPELAVHPMCGTNLVVGGMVAGLASLAALWTIPEQRRPARAVDALPRLMLAGTAAAVASQALGPLVQSRLTTHPDTEGVAVERIERRGGETPVIHRVELQHP